MNAAKTGIVAEFETGYLQRAIRIQATVAGGTDSGLRVSTDKGYAPRRLVQITNTAGVLAIAAPTTAPTATSIGSATHIIAQTDDSIREMPEDRGYPEKLTTMPNNIVKNSATAKTVAVYKIVNADDIKLINLS